MLRHKARKLISDPLGLINHIASKRLLNWQSDKSYLKLLYYVRLRESLNLNKPITFNQKLQWLKLYDRNPSYNQMVDKYEVREYIKSKIGKRYLIPLIGVWNDFDEIDFNKLPSQFVLKCTHDSGGVIVCKDKRNLNVNDVKKKVTKKMNKNYYYLAREWPYKDVKPRIICEKYMTDESGDDLTDYKIMCFNGKVRCIFVCTNRLSKQGLNIDVYDEDWNLMPFGRANHPNSGNVKMKPKQFKQMKELAEKLSKNIPFIRVDFYIINESLYFGELTLYPGGGFERFDPPSYDKVLGDWLELPSKFKMSH